MNRSLPSAASLALLVTSVSGLAAAQAEAQAPMPNVLLAVDSSGSMERKSGSMDFPQCDPTGSGVNERSRWIDLIEVLTGTIQNYRCQAIDRTSGSFRTEFALPGGHHPVDYQYRNPYHRPLSGSCAFGPNNAEYDSSNAFAWTEPFLREYSSPTLPCGGSFQQSSDGLIDVYGSFIRFGLMTLDTLPDAGRGYDGLSPEQQQGRDGAWSYYVDAPRQGGPANCIRLEPFEVGARNAAAPPWEGRLVSFGPSTPTLVEHDRRNDHVQQVLLNTRPYGASPLAGLLDDAREFLTRDDTEDESRYVGPQADPLVTADCREQAVILLTDGEPNLDLRPHCEGPGGHCPFDRTHEVAGQLSAAGIRVFVVGFAASESGGVDCKAMSDTDLFAPEGACFASAGDRALQACCTLHRIAFEGGTERAYFAQDQAELRTELNRILAGLSSGASSRTRATTAPANDGAGNAKAKAYRFLSAFGSEALDDEEEPPPPGAHSFPTGRLVRQRYECPDDGSEIPVPVDIRDELGDDFVANMESSLGPERRFYTLVAENGEPGRTIRPDLEAGDPDGLGDQGGAVISGGAQDFTVALMTSPGAIPTNPTASNCVADNGTPLSANECAERILRWTVGLDNGTDHRRCADRTACTSLMGAIFRSTPRVVDRPGALIQDESYERFASQFLTRPMTVYTSSNDGFLHAFKVRPNGYGALDLQGDPPDEDNVDELRNNELWALLPPAVLPSLQAQYPGIYQRLLDGEPIVKDVPAELVDGKYRFERGFASARGATNTFRTVLVQAFGEGWPGYFAVDITEPDPENGTGPRFLWQVTTAADGSPLFGSGGTPLITTVFIDQQLGEAKEVSVAVLPGGKGGAPTGSACDRAFTDFDHLPADYRPRPQVNCYPASAHASRSVTIVRLDTGEVLRTFRANQEAIPNALRAANLDGAASSFESVTTEALFDSPVTGRPVAFPADVGAVADRVYVGDQDGTLWKLDLSKRDPEEWEVVLLFDGYTVDTDADAWRKGQPIETPPILSIDDHGRISINFSTGDQEALSANDIDTYVWSISEGLDASNDLMVVPNWYRHFENGERVTGPMILLQSTLYFSTYVPPDLQECGGEGQSRIWGVDYVRAGNNDGEEGGNDTPPVPSDGPTILLEEGPFDGLVAGVALVQLPSCVDQPDTSTANAYFPSYVSTPRSQPRPGALQITFQTGSGSGTDGSGGINARSITIPPPSPVSRIESWAAIVD